MDAERRWVLLNPGPVNVTERVRRALLGPDLCHREPEFSALLKNIRKKILRVFGVEKSHTVAVFTGSGTLAVEAMLVSYGALGRKILVISNGVYGERLRDILRAHRLEFSFLSAPLGRFPSSESIEAALKKDRRIAAVALVHHETSTGMLNPVDRVSALCRKYKKELIVDAVSSLGAEELELKSLALCAGSSGKCLHGFPGVSFVIVSKPLASALSRNRAGSVYMDVGAVLKAEDADAPPFTPAVQLYYAFDEALSELSREGLRSRIRSYAEKSAYLEREFLSAGLRFLVSPGFRSHALTALWLPPAVTYRKLHDGLKARGFVIYAGQSSLAGRIFRVSNLGDVRLRDLKRFARALRRLLPRPRPKPKAIVLAAGVGRRFGAATRRTPKCLLPIGGTNLLRRYLDAFRGVGIGEVVVVCGHLKRLVKRECARYGRGLKIRFVENPDYRGGSLRSLMRAGRELDRDVLVMDADVYFPAEALDRLLFSDHESAFLIDPSSKSAGEEMMVMARRGRIVEISKRVDRSLTVLGEATGILKLSRRHARLLLGTLRELCSRGIYDVEYEESYSALAKKIRLGTETMEGLFWSEIDFPADLERVQKAVSV